MDDFMAAVASKMRLNLPTEPSAPAEPVAIETPTEVEAEEVTSETTSEPVEPQAASSSEVETEEASDEGSSEDVPADFEMVSAVGPKGRKEIKVDYSDKEKIKRAYQKAYSGELFKKQRDQYKKEIETSKDAIQAFTKLSDTYEKHGAIGLINSLEGGQDALTQYVNDRIEEALRVNGMTDDEKRSWAEEQARLKEQSEAEALRQRLAKYEEDEAARREEQEVNRVQSMITPSYERNSFSGKLGNERMEDRLNDLMWKEAMAAVEALPEGTQLTAGRIDKIFRDTRSSIETDYQLTTKKQVSKAVEKQKVQALASAQLSTKETAPKSAKKELENLAQSGDIRGYMRQLLIRN